MTAFKVSFIAEQKGEFESLIQGTSGTEPIVSIIADVSSSGLALYHEAGIYHAATRSIFITSNQLPNDETSPNTATSNKHVKLFRFYDDPQNLRMEEVSFPGIEGAMLNGGTNFYQNSLLLCAQGSKDTSDLSGIIKLPIPTSDNPHPIAETIVSSFHGIPFNSVNDVVVHPEDSSIWFTDPSYGFHQEIRPQPKLPSQVYRFDQKTGSIRAIIAGGFTRPNGLCFSPDLKTLYVTDTGAIHGSTSVPIDLAGPSHIYAFDIVYPDGQSEPFLANRRLFAYAPGRFPDGVKCDSFGRVYSGCGNGIQIWNPYGVLIGTIEIPGGVANFCFGEEGVIYAFNETRVVKIHLKGKVGTWAFEGRY